MRFLQITTLVALVASVSAVAVPKNTPTPRLFDLKLPGEVFHGMISGIDNTFSDVKGGIEKALNELMPHKHEILEKVKPAIEKAAKGMKHPENLKALKPKIDKAIQDIKPELENADKDTRPHDVVMKELRTKIDNAFKDLKPEIEKVWHDIKPGLLNALDDVWIGTVVLGLLPMAPVVLLIGVVVEVGDWILPAN